MLPHPLGYNMYLSNVFQPPIFRDQSKLGNYTVAGSYLERVRLIQPLNGWDLCGSWVQGVGDWEGE